MTESNNPRLDSVAIIGMAGRFPGAATIGELWRELLNGNELITFFTDEELTATGVDRRLLAEPRYVRARGVLEDADCFDRSFFGYSARDAELLDPQQRIFLETAWCALEDGGYAPSRAGRVGVFAGASVNSYLLTNLLSREDLRPQLDPFELMLGNDKDFIATRVSYHLNLGGPSVNVQTACSTSLVAVHMACQSLLVNECDMALAGGASAIFPEKEGYLYTDGGILSPDGHCRPFDARANGMVSGSGVGVVLLKRLEDALRDGDFVYAVIEGTAINNDGSGKVAYSAPSVEGQADVIAEALAMAGVDARSIGFIEAHGTATPIGDPIEVAALRRVFRHGPADGSVCWLGSIKSNIGHAGGASGVAGLIKAALAVRHGIVPPTVHFTEPNPALELERSPFAVNTSWVRWSQSDGPRRAGVSSFGIGGTNAHAVLREPPIGRPRQRGRAHHLLTLSAKSPDALTRMRSRLADHLEQTASVDLADVAFTLQRSRSEFAHRISVACTSVSDAVIRLRSEAAKASTVSSERVPSIVFAFPGVSASLLGAGAELYQSEPTFRAWVDQGATQLSTALGVDLVGMVSGSKAARVDDERWWEATQFVVQLALAKLWIEWGVKPDACVGRGIGCAVAAYVAGALSLDEAANVVVVRARLGTSPRHEQSRSNAEAEATAWGERLARAIRPPQIPILSAIGGEPLGLAELSCAPHYLDSMPTVDLPDWPEVQGAVLVELGRQRETQARQEPERVAASASEARQGPCSILAIGARTADELVAGAVLIARGGPMRDARPEEAQERLAVVADSPSQAREQLALWSSGQPSTVVRGSVRAQRSEFKTAFVFTGHGAQYVGMGARLYQTEPVFKRALDRCAELSRGRLARPLLDVVLRDGTESGILDDWVLSQTAVFSLEIALAELWRSWGIEPTVVLGHSVGEYAAAYTAGVFSLEGGLDLVIGRATLVRDQSLPGVMMAAFASESRVREVLGALGDRVAVAAVNGPHNLTLAGPAEAMATARIALDRASIESEELRIAHPSHCPAVRPVLDAYEQLAERVRYARPAIRVIANETGLEAGEGEMSCGSYWRRQLGKTVQFARGVETLRSLGIDAVIEVGPSSTLLGVVRQSWPDASTVFVSSMKRGADELRHILGSMASLYLKGAHVDFQAVERCAGVTRLEEPPRTSSHGLVQSLPPAGGAGSSEVGAMIEGLARLWRAGVDVSASGLYAKESRGRVPLPTYPFARERYAIEASRRDVPPTVGDVAALQKDPDPANWLYRVVWTPQPRPQTTLGEAARVWLVLADPGTWGVRVGAALEQRGHRVTWVSRGTAFTKIDSSHYCIRPCHAEDFDRLCGALWGTEDAPTGVVHLWDTDVTLGQPDRTWAWDARHTESFFSLVFLAQALDRRGFEGALRVELISRGLQQVVGTESVYPPRGLALGACRVIPHEYPNIRCRSTDLPLASGDHATEQLLLDGVVAELLSDPRNETVALRGPRRWRQSFERYTGGATSEVAARFRHGGTYLITGGLGGVGLLLAERLAKTYQARVVLTTRKKLPAREDWSALLEGQGAEDTREQRAARALLEIERLGGDVLVVEADAGDLAQMQAAVEACKARFGALHGVIHAARLPEADVLTIARLGVEVCEQQFHAKAEGAAVLAEALQDCPLDFVLLTSSLAVLGGIGEATYAAANLFLDGMAHAQNRIGKTLWISVNSDAWPNATGGERRNPLLPELLQFAMTPDEGFAAIARILSLSDPTQVLLSMTDLGTRIERWFTPASADVDAKRSERPHARPNVGPYVAPRDAVEKRIATIWQDLLGFDQVGVLDDFRDLGGHSLLAIRILSRVRDALHVHVPLQTMMQSPCVAGMAAAVAAAQAERAPSNDLNGGRGSDETSSAAGGGAIPRRTSRDLVPLSIRQERQWFLSQLDPMSPAYNVCIPFEFAGRLNSDILERSLLCLLQRHEVLRSRPVLVDGRPRMKIEPASDVSFTLSRIDLRDRPEEDREAEARALLERDVRRPFELLKEPLIRAILIEVADQRCFLLINMHHLIIDGWSMGILWRELDAVYSAMVRGAQPCLPEVPVRFSDYVEWEHEQLAAGAFESDREYWKNTLSGDLPLLKLPTDFPAPSVQAFRGALESLEIESLLADSVNELSKATGVTPTTTLLAAFAVLLARYSDAPEVAIGMPVANRGRTDLESTIGVFANTTLLRTVIDPDRTFRDLLHQVHGQVLEALNHQELPFEALLDELNIRRDAGSPPLFRVIFDVAVPPPPLRLGGLTGTMVPVDSLGAMSDLMFNVFFQGEQPSFKMEYRTDLFERGTIVRMLGHYRTLLEEVSENPDRPLWQLTLERQAPAATAAVETNPASRESGVSASGGVLRAFELEAKRSPGAIALAHQKRAVSYDALRRMSNGVAKILRAAGPENSPQARRVALLCRDRLLEAVALVGILKAGAVGVPLCAADPEAVLRKELEAAGPALILSEPGLVSSLPHCGSARVLALDFDAVANLGADEQPFGEPRGSSPALAFGLAAGGVHLDHGRIARRVEQLRSAIALSPSDVVLNATPYWLEGGVLELLGALASGARVVVVDEKVTRSARSLHDVLVKDRVSVAQLTASDLASLAAAIGARDEAAEGPERLRAILTVGESLHLELARAVQRLWRCNLYRSYAPPEAAFDTGWHRFDGNDTARACVAFRELGGVVKVLDSHGQPVLIGGEGDVWVEGPRAVGSPASSDVEPVFARTMDIGRVAEGQTIEIVGCRARRAWKRSIRIDLAEVERVLLDASAVDAAVVRMRETGLHRWELVAYVVTSAAFSRESIETHLRRELPEHLVPDVLIPVSCLPLTRGGMMDEQALARIEALDADLVSRWERAVRSEADIDDAIVTIEATPEKIAELSIADLVPEAVPEVPASIHAGTATPPGAAPTGTATADAVLLASEDEPPNAAAGPSVQAELAILDGGPLQVRPEDPATMADALVASAKGSAAIVYIHRDGSQTQQSYAQLLDDALRLLSVLRDHDLKPGDRAILQVELLPDLYVALWACILGGIVPACVAIAPTYRESNAVVRTLVNSWKLLEHPPILTTARLAPDLAALGSDQGLNGLRLCVMDGFRAHAPAAVHKPDPQAVAVFQLSSGSTGMPKCVRITHSGLVHHMAGLRQFDGDGPDDVVLSWISIDHVGSLMMHLISVFFGAKQVQIPTDVVIAEPLRLLDVIDAHRVTYSFMPNFGFRLVANRLEQCPDRTWDLSCMRTWLNGGEQVTVEVLRDFLSRTERFFLRQAAMKPSFGMAETCTAITFNKAFRIDACASHYLTSSLDGSLRRSAQPGAETTTFVDLGGVIPGVQVRIADSDHRTLPAGRIGRMLVRGAVVTPGYLNNPAANEETMLSDGWFDSGDLGFVRDGKLTITGRAKETIVVRGVKYFCFDIEDVVHRVPGVEPTYVAACAVEDPRAKADGFAVFFVAKPDVSDPVEIVRAIRDKVTAEIGIAPSAVVPISKEAFPKTTSGKIVRLRLSRAFKAGAFHEVLKTIEGAGTETVPDWFYERIWRPMNATAAPAARVGRTLVVLDGEGLGERLVGLFERQDEVCIQVESGPSFERLGPHRYRLHFAQTSQWKSLFEILSTEGVSIERIFHLGTYGATGSSEQGDGEQAQQQPWSVDGLFGVLALVQGVAATRSSGRTPVRLWIVSSGAQATSPGETVAPERTAILGLVKTIPLELPWLKCRHVDLELASPDLNAGVLSTECLDETNEQEVAYRGRQRWVPRFSKIDMRRETARAAPFKAHGRYVVTGGLGGLGVEVVKYLRSALDARVLILGRTALAEEAGQGSAKAEERARAYRSVADEAVAYEAVDVSDRGQVEAALARARIKFGGEIDGVVHLAGTIQERPLTEETPATLMASLQAKVGGACILDRAIGHGGDSVFVSFSSAISMLGTYGVGAYAIGNRFLDGFSHQRRQRAPKTYCLHWSQWDNVGMTQAFAMKTVLADRGVMPIGITAGIHSFAAVVRRNRSSVLVGLDGSKPAIARYVDAPVRPMEHLCTWFASRSGGEALNRLRELTIHDRFGVKPRCAFVQLSSIPRTVGGQVDWQALSASASSGRQSGWLGARDDVERKLVQIWREVLQVERVGVRDSFFDLGGHSLKAVRLMARIEEEFKQEVPLSTLFEGPTVEALARALRSESARTWSPLVSLGGSGSGRPFFCVHGGGGVVFCYRDLAREMGDNRPFFAIQAVGLEEGQVPLTRIEDMASTYIEAIRAVQPEGPYLLGGWSFGGPVAFEMARQLHERGQQVQMLLLLDPVPPSRRAPSPDPTSTDIMTHVAADVGIALPQAFGDLSLSEQVQVFLESLRGSPHLPADLTLDQVQRFIAYQRANWRALDQYTHRSHSGPTTILTTGHDGPELMLGWKAYVTGPMELYQVPGTHSSMIEIPHVRHLAMRVNSCLESSEGLARSAGTSAVLARGGEAPLLRPEMAPQADANGPALADG